MVEHAIHPLSVKAYLLTCAYSCKEEGRKTMMELSLHFQTSLGEMKTILKTISAFQDDDKKWTILKEDIVTRIFSDIIELIIEDELPVEAIRMVRTKRRHVSILFHSIEYPVL